MVKLIFSTFIFLNVIVLTQWQTIQTPTPAGSYLRGISVVSPNVILSAGGNSEFNTIVRSTNGGINWLVLPNPPGISNIFLIEAVSENTFFVTDGLSKGTYKTTNAGQNWYYHMFLPGQGMVNEIRFFNSNTGFAIFDNVPNNDTINFCYTRDCGASWTVSGNSIIWNNLLMSPGHVGFKDTNLIWAVFGNQSGRRFAKLTGGLGNSWQIYDFDNYKAQKVLFIDQNTGLAGTDSSVIKTTDGGSNWFLFNNQILNLNYALINIFNVPGTSWIIVNSPLQVRISYDYCNTWQNIVNGNSNGYSFHYIDAVDTNSIYLTGDQGRVYKYNFAYLGIPIGISGISSGIPSDFMLHQNYPNPFNPVTIIRFELPVASDVRLLIYDVNGRIVDEIVNGHLEKGVFEIKWNADKFSSGIYYYTLITDKFTETKKMVLVK